LHFEHYIQGNEPGSGNVTGSLAKLHQFFDRSIMHISMAALLWL